MRRSKKSYLSDLPEITAGIEIGKTKSITYKDYEYTYRVDKYKMYKDYCAVVVIGGPHKYRATTTCKRSRFKTVLKGLIQSLTHK